MFTVEESSLLSRMLRTLWWGFCLLIVAVALYLIGVL